MSHFVAYHNAETIGYAYEDAPSLAFGTRKSALHTIGGRIWVISGVGTPRQYTLHESFVVETVEPADQPEFTSIIAARSGDGFEPGIPLNSLAWFRGFLKSQNNFSLGLQRIEARFIPEFERLLVDHPTAPASRASRSSKAASKQTVTPTSSTTASNAAQDWGASTRAFEKHTFPIHAPLERITEALEDARDAAESERAFEVNNLEEGRQRVLRQIVQRQGQRGFRDALLRAYEGRCAISGCAVLEVLEAAHIMAYRGEATQRVANGLLLRADLHTLFDLGWLGVDPKDRTVRVHPELHSSEYAKFHGQALRLPRATADQPSADALRWHLEYVQPRVSKRQG